MPFILHIDLETTHGDNRKQKIQKIQKFTLLSSSNEHWTDKIHAGVKRKASRTAAHSIHIPPFRTLLLTRRRRPETGTSKEINHEGHVVGRFFCPPSDGCFGVSNERQNRRRLASHTWAIPLPGILLTVLYKTGPFSFFFNKSQLV